MSSLKKVLTAFRKCEEIIMVLAFIIMVVTMFGSVLARNVFKVAIPWFDELARIAMVYMVLLGAEVGLRDGTQVSVTAVTDKLHGKVKKVVAILARIVLTVFCGAMTAGTIYQISQSLKRNATTTALNWPIAIPYAAILIGFLVATIIQAVTVLDYIRTFNQPEEEKEVTEA